VAPAAAAAGMVAQGHRAPQVEVRIVFPCEAGRFENLNTVFGVVYRGIKRDGARAGRGAAACSTVVAIVNLWPILHRNTVLFYTIARPSGRMQRAVGGL
jgi:hypothetical protein